MSENGGAVNNLVSAIDVRPVTTVLVGSPLPAWYAIQTRSRHEKKVTAKLEEKGVCAFLPLVTALHTWSDRRREVQLPLFPGYVFVRIAAGERGSRNTVLQTGGVTSFVGVRGSGIPISDKEIESVQAIIAGGIPFTSYPFLNVGHRVRIRGGSLDGIEGILVAKNGDQSLVVSVQLIQRSLALRVVGYQVERI